MIAYTSQEKALRACADLAHWHAEVKRLSDEIRAGFDACWQAQGGMHGGHVDEAVEASRTVPVEDGGYAVFDADAVDVLLSRTCPHCTRVWRAGKERKAARKQLGIAKRRVLAIGRGVGPCWACGQPWSTTHTCGPYTLGCGCAWTSEGRWNHCGRHAPKMAEVPTM